MDSLADKTVLITGGAGGIGRGLAQAFGRQGAVIALADIDAASLAAAETALDEVGVTAWTTILDTTNHDAWEIVLNGVERQFGCVDILCNNAGTSLTDPIATADPRHWRRVIDVNLLGYFYGCRAALPRMLAGGEQAHIVNLASLSGLRANGGTSAYAASKFGVVGLTDSLREELRGTRVGVSLVCPGAANTGFLTNAGRVVGRVPDPAMARVLAAGMDPVRIGERIVQAVLADEYHVFTHAGLKPDIEALFAERIAAMDLAGDAGDEDVAALRAAMVARKPTERI